MNKKTEMERRIIKLQAELDEMSADIYVMNPDDEEANKETEIDACLDTIAMLARKAKANRHAKAKKHIKRRAADAERNGYEVINGKLRDHGMGHVYSTKKLGIPSVEIERATSADKADAIFKDSGYEPWAPSKFLNVSEYDDFTIVANKLDKGEPAVVITENGPENGEIVYAVAGYDGAFIDDVELIGMYKGNYDYSGEFFTDDGCVYVWIRC